MDQKIKVKNIVIPSVLLLLSLTTPILLQYEGELLNKQYGIWGLIYRITVIAAYLVIGLLFGLLSRKRDDDRKGWLLSTITGGILILLIIVDCILYVSGNGLLFCQNFAFSISLCAGFLLFCGNLFSRHKIMLCCFTLYFLAIPFLDIGIKSIKETTLVTGLFWLSVILKHLLFIAAGILFALPSDVYAKDKKQVIFPVVVIIVLIGAIICKESFLSHTVVLQDTLMIWDLIIGYCGTAVVKTLKNT